MIRFLNHDEIDKTKWDECIENAFNSRVYAMSWYLDIVSPGWCALVDEKYTRVFPLPVKSKFGLQYIIQPHFTQQIGLFSLVPATKEIENDFFKKIPARYIFIDICVNSTHKFLQVAEIVPARNLILNLSKNYLNIYTNYKTNLQRNLNKATNQSFTISYHCRPEELVQLFRNNRGASLEHLTDKEYDIICKIAYKTLHTGNGEIWGIYDEYNQLCAGVLWVKHKDRYIFLFSALSQSGKQNHAMPFLIDSYIQRHAEEKVFLDFEGSNNEGLARFYSSFGADEETYFRFTNFRLPWGIKHLAKWLKIR